MATVDKQHMLLQYEKERKQLRADLPIAALKAEKIEELSDAKVQETLKKREEWVMKEAKLAAESLCNTGALPYSLAWGEHSQGVAQYIAE